MVSLNDVDCHGTHVLLQDEANWIAGHFALFHHKRTGCADRGVSREVELRSRCEDAHPTGVRGIVLRQDEGRFAEIELASNLLHALGRDPGCVRENRELVPAEGRRAEDIEDVKCVLHEINLLSVDEEVDLNRRRRGRFLPTVQ